MDEGQRRRRYWNGHVDGNDIGYASTGNEARPENAAGKVHMPVARPARQRFGDGHGQPWAHGRFPELRRQPSCSSPSPRAALSLNGDAFTVNGSALIPGSYVLIQQASGSVAELRRLHPIRDSHPFGFGLQKHHLSQWRPSAAKRLGRHATNDELQPQRQRAGNSPGRPTISAGPCKATRSTWPTQVTGSISPFQLPSPTRTSTLTRPTPTSFPVWSSLNIRIYP